MLLTRPRHSQCSSPIWAAGRLLAAARQQYYSTDDHSNSSDSIKRADATQKWKSLFGTTRVGAVADVEGHQNGEARGRDACILVQCRAQTLTRQPGPEIRRNADKQDIGDEMEAGLSEPRLSPKDAISMDSPARPIKPQGERPRNYQTANKVKPRETLKVMEKPNTILEELFPEYKEELSNTADSNYNESSTRDLPKLDPAALGLPQSTSWQPLSSSEVEQPFLHPDHQPSNPTSTDRHTLRQRLAATVLVVSSVSRHLALSDFVRLSPRGEHIEGWTSGILRVIPGRHHSTLARRSHYFLLFSTIAAAIAYRDNIRRLHSLSQKWTPTCPTSRPPPIPGIIIDGEDVGALVNAFTIVPNTQNSLFGKIIKPPYRPAVARMIETGGYHPLITPQADRQGENLVLVELDQGRMSPYELGLVIRSDGKQRNLSWRLEGGKEDIILLGPRDNSNMASDDEDEDWKNEVREDDEVQRARRKMTESTGPPRFIVKFKDSAEARRFVRAWHSRRLEGYFVERLVKAGKKQQAKVSAEILW